LAGRWWLTGGGWVSCRAVRAQNTTCADGYRGPLCAGCAPGFSADDDGCAVWVPRPPADWLAAGLLPMLPPVTFQRVRALAPEVVLVVRRLHLSDGGPTCTPCPSSGAALMSVLLRGGLLLAITLLLLGSAITASPPPPLPRTPDEPSSQQHVEEVDALSEFRDLVHQVTDGLHCGAARAQTRMVTLRTLVSWLQVISAPSVVFGLFVWCLCVCGLLHIGSD
jgi:hypothetical protein